MPWSCSEAAQSGGYPLEVLIDYSYHAKTDHLRYINNIVLGRG